MRNDDSDKMTEKSTFVEDHPPPGIKDPMSDCAPACQSAALRVREYVAPRNEIEAGVAEILAGLLIIERVGIHDNFILLGGESLLAAQAAWRIGNRFGCEVSLRSILAGTVANIAAEILKGSGNPQIQ